MTSENPNEQGEFYPEDAVGLSLPVNAEELRARDQFGAIFVTPDTAEVERWAKSLHDAMDRFLMAKDVVDHDSPINRALRAITELAFSQFQTQVERDIRRALAATISNLQINVDEHDSSLEVGIIIRDSIARQIKG